jgi:hypothetical protein
MQVDDELTDRIAEPKYKEHHRMEAHRTLVDLQIGGFSRADPLRPIVVLRLRLRRAIAGRLRSQTFVPVSARHNWKRRISSSVAVSEERFAKDAGFNNTLTAENSGACPMPRNTTANVSAAPIACCWSAQYRSPKNLIMAALEAAA